MIINLQTLKFKAKQDLTDYVNEKVGRLSRFDPDILSAEVTLSIDGTNDFENKICEIQLVVPGNDDFVRKNAATFEEAIHSSVEILQKVLQRKKGQD